MLDGNTTKNMVRQHTWLTGRLLHLVAKLLVPVVTKVFPPAKSCLKRLSLILNSNLPPCLQALGETALYNINENVILVGGHPPVRLPRPPWASKVASMVRIGMVKIWIQIWIA